jgi:hypothetical protein
MAEGTDRADTVSANGSVALTAIAIGVVYLAVSWHTTGPAYLEDEVGYLANAALFAGHAIDAASSYHGGYSLLIAPAFLLDGPQAVWKGVLTINAALWAASFAMLQGLLRRLLPGVAPNRLLTATVVAALYPTWIVSSGYAFATSAFVAVYLACLLALSAWSARSAWSILPHAALTGYMYWVHPTGAAVVVASVIAVALEAWRRRDATPLLLHVLVAGLFVVAYQAAVHPAIAAAMTPAGYWPHSHYPSLASALRTTLTAHGFALFATLTLGQCAYFIVASFGLAGAGASHCARRALARADDAKAGANMRPVCAVMAAAPLGLMALASISFFQWDHFEGDFWIYGRYLDGAVLPVLAVGIAVFRADRRLAALSIVLGLVGLLLHVMTPPDDAPNIVNTAAFWPQYLAPKASFFVWMLLGAVAVAAVALVGRRLAIALMIAAFPLGVYQQTAWHDWLLATFSAPSPLAEAVRHDVPRGSCVGVDPKLPDQATLMQSERHHLNAFYLFDYGYRRMSATEWLAQCDGPYLTWDDTPVRDGQARLIARDAATDLLLLQKTDPSKPR